MARDSIKTKYFKRLDNAFLIFDVVWDAVEEVNPQWVNIFREIVELYRAQKAIGPVLSKERKRFSEVYSKYYEEFYSRRDVRYQSIRGRRTSALSSLFSAFIINMHGWGYNGDEWLEGCEKILLARFVFRQREKAKAS